MSRGSLSAWTVSLGLLAGVWAGVVVVLGSLLPAAAGSEGGDAGTGGPVLHTARSYPLPITRKVPCTNETVTLDLTLDLDTKWRVDGEWVDFVVQAKLAGSPSGPTTVQVVPSSAHFGFSSPQYGKTGHLHEMHTLLLGQPVAVELVVGIEQAMDGSGLLIVQPGQVRVVCV
jgi:hypothetical protein